MEICKVYRLPVGVSVPRGPHDRFEHDRDRTRSLGETYPEASALDGELQLGAVGTGL